MADRLDLHRTLVKIFNSNHVYYQPSENLKLEYPAIKYSIGKIESRYANDAKYSKFNRYDVIVIDRKPDNEVIQKILELPYSSFDRHYVSDNLNHDSIILYF